MTRRAAATSVFVALLVAVLGALYGSASPLAADAEQPRAYSYDVALHNAQARSVEVPPAAGPRSIGRQVAAAVFGSNPSPNPSVVAAEAEGTVLEESTAAGRAASTEWGQTVQDFRANGDAWSQISAHAEEATGRTYRGGLSIEEVFERGDQWLVRHRIYDAAGDIVHETFRPYGKFGAP